jgi:hypothetical protein
LFVSVTVEALAPFLICCFNKNKHSQQEREQAKYEPTQQGVLLDKRW